MEILLVVLLGAGILYYLYKKMNQPDNMNSFNETTGTPTIPPVTPMPEPQPVPVVETVKAALDVNNDGKVDLADVKEVAKKTRARVKKAADLDGDGRVTVKDVKVATNRARKTANAVADRAAKTARKPRVKK